MQALPIHDLTRLEPLAGSAAPGGDSELRKAAEQFEAMLLHQMIKSMRDAVPRSSGSESGAMDKYESMHDRELALQLAHRGVLGFADQIERQLSPAGPSLTTPTNTAQGALSIRRAEFKPVTQADSPESGREVTFSRKMAPYAETAAARLGTTPEVLIAQAALETGWGQFVPEDSDGTNSNNMFGIKADQRWSKSSVTQLTTEFVGAQPRRQVASFRAYDTFAESFSDYAEFVGGQSRYAQALDAKSPRAYLEALQQAGYATDPRYADKVMALLPRVAPRSSTVALNTTATNSEPGQ